MKFRLKEGSHWFQGELHQPGAVLETDDQLDKAFPGRFEVVGGAQAPATPPPPITPPAVTPPPTEAAPAPVAKPKGKLADEWFNFEPEGTGLHVYRRGTKYFVYDEDDPKTPLNDKGLAKAEVLPFIESQCEG